MVIKIKCHPLTVELNNIIACKKVRRFILYTKNNPLNKRLFLLSGRRDSNPESLGPKPSALAVTLRPVNNFLQIFQIPIHNILKIKKVNWKNLQNNL